MSKNITYDLIQKAFEGKEPSPPKFFLTFGPPGSGKSTILAKLLEQFKINEDDLVQVLVDNFVEQAPGYLDDVKAIVDMKLSEKEQSQKLTEVYFRYRKSYGDAVSDGVLYQALAKKFNIVWETTGNSIEYAIKTIYEARLNGYLVFLIYPFVETENLKERAKKRAKTSKNPRLPDEAFIASSVIKAQKNFKTISKYVDKAFVYNNNEADLEKIKNFITIENNYKDYCSDKTKYCSQGIEKKVTCDKRELSKLSRVFDKDFGTYVNKICSFDSSTNQ